MKNTMRKNVFTRAFPGLVLLAAGGPLLAGNVEEGYTLTPFVGGYTFDDSQNMESSALFGLRGGYNFSRHWTAELAFSYVLAESELPNYPETDAYSYGLDALYHFSPDGTWVPFLAAGVGSTSLERPAPGVGDNDEWLVNVGGGIKYFLSDAVALRGDVRHIMLPDSSDVNWAYSLGVTFLLGDKPLPPVAAAGCAACPDLAPDTTAPYVTLSLPYNGSFNVPVYRKTRIAFSEAIDPGTVNSKTVQLFLGKEQIPGSVVATTGTAASFTQTGALLPDTVYIARVTTGVRDLAGNALPADYVWTFKTAAAPDPKIAPQVVVIDHFVMLEDTNFEFDSAKLTPTGKNLLESNIRVMKDNPKLKARIAGYTSASGTAAYNQALSERRADTVLAYIVDDGGIDPIRLESIGYGETNPAQYEPIPTNIASKAAKANMRVLFEIIVK